LIPLHTNKSTLNKSVFFTSLFLIFFTTILAAIFPDVINQYLNRTQAWLVQNTGWVYVLFVGATLLFCFYLLVSRLGDTKLGHDHETPEYKNISWFAMLFSAGMGIGLMFWGVAEPMMHFTSPPIGEGGSVEAAKEAMKITFFHWGLHAWGIYAIFAVILAYSCYRKKLPLLPRSVLYPLIGERIYGRTGDLIDTFAVVGTMFGVASSLGLGVTQVNAGLNYLFDIPQSNGVQVLLIAIITTFATVSVVLGLDGGIKKLSSINMILALLMMGFILVLGNTVGLLQAFVENTGAYMSDLVHKTFNLYAYEKKESWIGGWTLLYWAWWISWSPFVGMFIARISKGRSIREFMVGVLFVPAGFTFLWMTIFGNSGLDLVLNSGASELATAVSDNVSVALFKFFEYFPLSNVLSVLGLLLVVTFFVSSSDSGSLVIDTLTSGGARHPPVWQRIFWAITEGVVASILLYAGGLNALQTMTIVSALPIIVIISLGAFGFWRSLLADHRHFTTVQNHTTVLQYSKSSSDWKDRIASLTKMPKQTEAAQFVKFIVRPALEEISSEMVAKGLKVQVQSSSSEDRCSLVVLNEKVEDFKYEVQIRSFDIQNYTEDKRDRFFRAEVFLRSGGQEYDIYGYTKEQVIVDAITQYEKHYQYLHLLHSDSVPPKES